MRSKAVCWTVARAEPARPRGRRRRRTEEPAEASHEEGAREVAADRFEVSDEILEVPSFLRDG